MEDSSIPMGRLERIFHATFIWNISTGRYNAIHIMQLHKTLNFVQYPIFIEMCFTGVNP